jgi:hypothetical protein
MRAADACHAVLEEALLAGGAAQGDATGDEARWLLDADSLVEQQGDIDREFSAYLEALRVTLVAWRTPPMQKGPTNLAGPSRYFFDNSIVRPR